MKAHITHFVNHAKRLITVSFVYLGTTRSKVSQEFTQAVFRGDWANMQLDADSPQYKKFSFIMEMSESIENNNKLDWLNDADLQVVSATLEYVSQVSTRLHKNVISADLYSKIVEHYYKGFSLHDQRTFINKVLSPTLPLHSLIPAFTHTDNHQVLNSLKKRQFQLLELLSKSRRASFDEFIRIISPKVYNITDLPLLYRQFYVHLYPSLTHLTTISQIQKALTYLCKFNSVTAFIIDRFLLVLKEEVHKNEILPLGRCLSLSNCFSMTFLRAETTLKKSISKQNYLKIFMNLSQRIVEFDGKKFTLSQLQNETTFNMLIDDLAEETYRKLSSYLQLHKNIDLNSNKYLPKIVQSMKQTNMKQLSSLDKQKIRKVIQLELLPSFICFCLSEVLARPYISSKAQGFINSTTFVNFIASYPCCPHIIAQIIYVSDVVRKEFSSEVIQSQALKDKLKSFRMEVNNFLNNTIKKNISKEIRQFYSPTTSFRQIFRNEWVWELTGEALAARLMQPEQDYTHKNLLGMLKEDNLFLYSRMGNNEQAFRRQTPSKKTIMLKFDLWDYPYYFDAVATTSSTLGQSKKIIKSSRLKRDEYIPPGEKIASTFY